MACTNQCVVDSCTHTPPNEVWDYNYDNGDDQTGDYTKFPVTTNDTFHDENIVSLRNSINDERDRRSISDFTFSSILGSGETGGDGGTIIYGSNAAGQEAMKECKNAINGIRSGTITFNPNDGTKVRLSHIQEMKVKLDSIRSECICYGNCPSKSVCSCYGDCGCNYSSFWGGGGCTSFEACSFDTGN